MPKQFHDRHLPVRPNLEQLKHQAKDLLHALQAGDWAALAEFRKHHPGKKLHPSGKEVAPYRSLASKAR